MGHGTLGQEGTWSLILWGQPHSNSQEVPCQGLRPYATPIISSKHWYEDWCVCVCSPVPTAAHLHTGDPWGPVFAIDARETLQKGELSLSLMPLRGTKRLMVEAKKGWEGKGKLQPCTESGAGHRVAPNRTKRSLCKGLSPS